MSSQKRGTMAELERWLGRKRETSDRLTLERARKLAATLDLEIALLDPEVPVVHRGPLGGSDGRPPQGLERGDPLPHGWHWIYFHEAVPRSALGEDGHERRGDFLPPVALDRRMWAGGTLRFLRPLRIGAEVTRTSTVRSIEEKEGRVGPLVFVTVEHRIHDAEGVALEEEQNLVYLNREKREASAGASGGGAGSGSPTVEPTVAPAESEDTPSAVRWQESFTADEVTLFRFSALTFNGHRIHYDRRYTVDVEGYPDIVVHGPLLALLLMGAGIRWASEAEDVGLDPDEPLTFRYRARQPVFCGQTVEFRGSPTRGNDRARAPASAARGGNGLELEVHGPHGDLAMQAELTPGS